MKKTIQKLIILTLTAALLFSLTACGSKNGNGSKWGSNTNPAQSSPAEATADSAATTDESVLTDGKITSSAWKDGVLKINGKIFILSKTTLEQFTESGYQADTSDIDYILYGDQGIALRDNKHQEIKLTTKNYSSDKPLYQKHALISGYTINFKVENGLEATDAILPGKIKGGMTKDEITTIMGTPDSDSTDTSIKYNYKENDLTMYTVNFNMNADTHLLESVTYDNRQEYANVTDDSNTILSSLDTNSESSLTSHTKPSDNLKDAEIKIGSNVYTMPISMTNLSDLGYSSDELNLIVNPRKKSPFTSSDLTDKGGNTLLSCEFYNPSNRPRACSHCVIYALTFTNSAENISIAKGIKVGSTYQEVCNAFGKKEKSKGITWGSDVDYVLNYSFSAKRGEVEATFFFKKDKIVQIDMRVEELTSDDA